MKIANKEFQPYQKVSELWVITVYYNPCGYKSRRSTYDTFMQMMHLSGINVLTVECAFGDDLFELPEAHAKIQSHTAVPSIYMNFDLNGGGNNGAAATAVVSTGEPPPLPLAERFKIIRIEVKNGKRVAGNVKIAVTGKMKTDERYVAATVTTMTGGWVKLTPTDPLPNGEYAVAEMLGKDGMNLYVWDFGVNPSAPANQSAWKPDPKETQPTGTQQKTAQPPDLLKRDSQ